MAATLEMVKKLRDMGVSQASFTSRGGVSSVSFFSPAEVEKQQQARFLGSMEHIVADELDSPRVRTLKRQLATLPPDMREHVEEEINKARREELIYAHAG